MRSSCLLTVVAVSCILVAASPTGEPTSAGNDWSFTHAPLFRPAADMSPVSVVSVTGDMKMGGVTRVELRQHGGPQARSVRLGWYLRVGETTEQVLQDRPAIHHGQTADIAVDKIQPDVTYPVQVIVVGYQEVRQYLPKDQKPGVAFIGVAVDQVEFVDGTKWVRRANAG